MSIKEPEKEVLINEKLVQELILKQYPSVKHLPITFLNSGWDNDNYKLGNSLLVRLPRRKLANELLENEIKGLNYLKDKLSLCVPEPLFVGKSSTSYPFIWAIYSWFQGEAANTETLANDEAIRLAHFLKELHQLKSDLVGENPYRSINLDQKNKVVWSIIDHLKPNHTLITPNIISTWEKGIKHCKPRNRTIIHGDLHPGNIISNQKKINAIIDWGDICIGDPALDLAAFWMLFNNKAIREKALLVYNADTELIIRAKAWAVFFGLVLFDSGLGKNTANEKSGRITLQNLDLDK